MDNETKTIQLIPHEVVIVGKLRDGKDAPIDPNLTGKDLRDAILGKFKFTRTSELNAEAIKEGLKAGNFYHIQVADPGGDVVVLKNGKKVRKNSETTKVGFDVVFERQRTRLYNELKGEILAGKFEPTAGDPNSGQITLTEFVIVGKWDEFPLGFKYNPHTFNPQTGKKEMLKATRKTDDGKYIKEPAVSKMGRHFVYEDEIDILEALRDTIREDAAKYKIAEPELTAGAAQSGRGDEKVVEPPKPETPPATPETDLEP